MQYILTEEEYKSLLAAGERKTTNNTKEFQKFCTMVADNLPIKVYWNKEMKEPWGCIHTSDGEWYCDECPAQKFCPSTKKYSK